MSRFRAPIVRGLLALAAAGAAASDKAPRIDRDQGIIYGASAMQAVEALGHGVLIDDITLAQVRDFGNAAPKGIKSRYTHPGMCEDGMGSMLGRQRNFRIEGDRVVGDLHLAAAAKLSPRGDLWTYTLELAEEDPAAFGMSVVITTFRAWKLANGSEIRTDDPSLRRGHGEDAYYARPEGATTDKPFVRVTALHNVDVVDEPAANRDGMFSAFAGTTNTDSSEAFAALDAIRERLHLSIDGAQAFVARYFAARSTTPSKDIPPMRYSLAVFTTILLANLAFSKELAEFDQDPKNKEATEADLKAYVVTLQAGAASKTADTLRTELASEKSARASDKLASDKAIADLTTKLAAQTKRADDLAALNKGSQGGNTVPGDHTTTGLSGLTGDALYDAEWDRDPKVRENFGQNKKAYARHRAEVDAKAAKA